MSTPSIDELVEILVAAAPDLTEEQRVHLQQLLRPRVTPAADLQADRDRRRPSRSRRADTRRRAAA